MVILRWGCEPVRTWVEAEAQLPDLRKMPSNILVAQQQYNYNMLSDP